MKLNKLAGLARFTAIGVGSLLVGPLGCGSQAGTGYEGESLLTISGKVKLADSDAPANLVPALAYVDLSGRPWKLHVVDTAVQGEFPAHFTLDVFDPPPSELTTDNPTPGVGRVAIARLTAVSPGHATTLEIPNEGSFTTCETGTGEVACTEEVIRCAPDGSVHEAPGSTDGACWHAKFSCPHATHIAAVGPEGISNMSLGDCTSDGDPWGNPAYGKALWQNFAGLSQNYLIAYVAHPSAGIDYMLHSSSPLAVGFHLVKVATLSDADVTASQDCESSAYDAAYATYDDAHGTSFTNDGQDPQPGADALNEIRQTALVNEVKASCRYSSLGGFTYDVVPSDDAHPVSIELGATTASNAWWMNPL
ncbi:MAG TPA: hypothetical protein VH062_19830 [Polyangiaceae bacterium]|jgi:hypothetical protein|nr:hypothetical protein [Polyangiaceae bacterium]